MTGGAVHVIDVAIKTDMRQPLGLLFAFGIGNKDGFYDFMLFPSP